MPTYISMLRGINVGGHNKVPMDKLRQMFESLGFKGVRTHIQSGNVIFKAAKSDPVKLSAKIEKKILAQFGFPVRVITRTPEELCRNIEGNPFAKECKAEPSKVLIAFLAETPSAEAVKKLEALACATELVRHSGREVYLYYRDGMGRAKLSSTLLEKALAVTATARNWNTVTKLCAMAMESAARTT
jgi:uncharacterized protein (DUF1697 family)